MIWIFDAKIGKFNKAIIISVALILLVGCLPVTIQGVRNKSPETFTFEVKENYKSVFQKIYTEALILYSGKTNVEGNLFTDSGFANVVISTLVIPLAKSTGKYMAIDIKKTSEDTTQVTSYYVLKSWKSKAQNVEKWIK